MPLTPDGQSLPIKTTTRRSAQQASRHLPDQYMSHIDPHTLERLKIMALTTWKKCKGCQLEI